MAGTRGGDERITLVLDGPAVAVGHVPGPSWPSLGGCRHERALGEREQTSAARAWCAHVGAQLNRLGTGERETTAPQPRRPRGAPGRQPRRPDWPRALRATESPTWSRRARGKGRCAAGVVNDGAHHHYGWSCTKPWPLRRRGSSCTCPTPTAGAVRALRRGPSGHASSAASAGTIPPGHRGRPRSSDEQEGVLACRTRRFPARSAGEFDRDAAVNLGSDGSDAGPGVRAAHDGAGATRALSRSPTSLHHRVQRPAGSSRARRRARLAHDGRYREQASEQPRTRGRCPSRGARQRRRQRSALADAARDGAWA